MGMPILKYDSHNYGYLFNCTMVLKLIIPYKNAGNTLAEIPLITGINSFIKVVPCSNLFFIFKIGTKLPKNFPTPYLVNDNFPQLKYIVLQLKVCNAKCGKSGCKIKIAKAKRVSKISIYINV